MRKRDNILGAPIGHEGVPRVQRVRKVMAAAAPQYLACVTYFPSRFPREALIKSLSDFILVFLFNARNKSTRIASYLRRLMTQHWIKIHMKFDSAN